MPAALIAITSMCSGHGCFPARKATTGSPDININNKPAHRKDDKWDIHQCTGSHDGFLSAGSPKMTWNNKPSGRVSDPVNCGSTAATGSSDTFID
jgi:uncharacterized Zn-binding protein involved in type VI secretion